MRCKHVIAASSKFAREGFSATSHDARIEKFHLAPILWSILAASYVTQARKNFGALITG